MRIIRVCLTIGVMAVASWVMAVMSQNVLESRGDALASLFFLVMIPVVAGVAVMWLWLIWGRPSYQDIHSWIMPD